MTDEQNSTSSAPSASESTLYTSGGDAPATTETQGNLQAHLEKLDDNLDDIDFQQGVSEEDYDVAKAIGSDAPEQAGRRLQEMSESMSDKLMQDEQQEYVRMKVPGDHDSAYESHHPSLNILDKLVEQDMKVDDFSEDEAERFAARQGLEATLRENARLNQDLLRADKARKRSALVTIVLSGVLISMIWAFMSYPKNRYIATMDNQAICPVDALNNPNLTDSQIANFAQSAATQLYTMDYINYPDQIEATLSRYFTEQGRIDAVNSFEQAGTLTNIATNALTTRAGATHAPRVEEKGIGNDGAPFWIVRFPMVLDIYSGAATPKESKKYIVSVRLRSDAANANNPTGLGVITINLVPDGS